VVYGVPSIRPDYARWLPILRNQLKDMDLSKIRHVLAFAVTNSLMHWIDGFFIHFAGTVHNPGSEVEPSSVVARLVIEFCWQQEHYLKTEGLRSEVFHSMIAACLRQYGSALC
jgi:hypothetical protein